MIAFAGAKSNLDNKYLEKIIEKSIEKTGLEPSADLESEAKTLLANGFEDETFCPVINTRKDGTEKRSVFNKSALVDYLSLNLKR